MAGLVGVGLGLAVNAGVSRLIRWWAARRERERLHELEETGYRIAARATEPRLRLQMLREAAAVLPTPRLLWLHTHMLDGPAVDVERHREHLYGGVAGRAWRQLALVRALEPTARVRPRAVPRALWRWRYAVWRWRWALWFVWAARWMRLARPAARWVRLALRVRGLLRCASLRLAFQTWREASCTGWVRA